MTTAERFYNRFQEGYPNLSDKQSEEIKAFILSEQKALLERLEEKMEKILVMSCGECKGKSANCGGCGGIGRPANSEAYELAMSLIRTEKEKI